MSTSPPDEPTPQPAASFDPFVIEGDYQDGQTSRSVPARLTVHSDGCDLVADQVRIEIAPDDLKLTDRLSNTPRRISWGSSACFVTGDEESADKLRQLLPNSELSNLPFRLENHLPLAVSSLVLVAALLGATLIWGIPAAANYLAFKVPNSVREASAVQTMRLLDTAYVEESQLPVERQNALIQYFRSADDFPSKILFRDGEELGANAFALPGGYVVFTDQLVELAEDDTQLMGVYLHEVGHARLRHAEISVLRDSAWLIALTLLTGDVSGVSEAVYTVPVALGQMAFSRDLEREADDFAISAMLASGIPPESLATMLEQLENSHLSNKRAPDTSEEPESAGVVEKFQRYLSSHPATKERMTRIRTAQQQRSQRLQPP